MGNLTMGMLLVFPVIAFLTMKFPKAIISIIGLIGLVTALIVLEICLAPVLLRFVSIVLFMAIFG
jgi:hypothetical protein